MTHPDPCSVPELLAPAGSPEAFNAALAAGADAIYCALGSDFNARRGARNFTYQTFEAACRAAHLAGARVYVTVNVVIRTQELPRALALVRTAWLLGADAFIVQDWGLMAELRERYPQLELHVSTQANVHDARGVAWCRALGVSRVTLSRELSVAEIARIAREGVELEGFGHGALCFCYSGTCLMSSLAGDRSANRGLCAQPCRLPYDLVDARGQVVSAPGRRLPLCPKDYCTMNDLGRLARAGLSSLKIEGRMKSPDYVHAVASAYRLQLDDLAAGREPDEAARSARLTRLRRAFNRDFTNSYLDGRSDDDMMSYERSNNRGELVGSVTASSDLGSGRVRRGGANGGRARLRSKTYATIDVLLDAPVGKGDLLEARPLADPSQFLTTLAPADAAAGETLRCATARPMPAGSPVRVIRSQAALDDAAQVAGGERPPRRQVAVRVVARRGEPFSVELACVDGSASACAEGFVVEGARTRAVTREDLVEHVGRMGQSPFAPASFDVKLDEGCGMGFSAVHAVRAEACRLLEERLLAPSGRAVRERGLARVPDLADIHAQLTFRRERGGAPARDARRGVPAAEVCALVPTPAVAVSALEAGATRLYATADALADAECAGRVWPGRTAPIPWLDEVCREGDHARLDPLVRAGEPCAVGNVSELALAAECGAKAEVRPCIPVHNESCLVALEQAGARGFWLSGELTLQEACDLGRMAAVPCGVIVSGRPRAMTSEHCVLQTAGRCIHDCARCSLRGQRLSLRDGKGQLLPVRTDLEGRSRIYAARPLDATPEVGAYLAAGVTRLMADCTLLSAEEAASAVARVVRAVCAVGKGERPAPRLKGTSDGHLFRPIA